MLSDIPDRSDFPARVLCAYARHRSFRRYGSRHGLGSERSRVGRIFRRRSETHSRALFVGRWRPAFAAAAAFKERSPVAPPPGSVQSSTPPSTSTSKSSMLAAASLAGRILRDRVTQS